MTKEALKLALEALEVANSCVDGYYIPKGKTHLPEIELAITAIKEALAQPEFIKHEVKNANDWSEWVCPDPRGYLMKCCDCGLVHEAEFGVVRYKSETEREDCDIVDDPNLQAVFRMRRSEEWTPEDTAHRSGGLPIAQPEQESVGEIVDAIEGAFKCSFTKMLPVGAKLYTTPPQRKPLTDEEIQNILPDDDTPMSLGEAFVKFARAIEAAHGIKGEA
jgi:hypothetical protein